MSIIAPAGGFSVPDTAPVSPVLSQQPATPTTTAAATPPAATVPSTSGTLGTVVNTTT